MKHLFILLILAALFSSCSVCPNGGGPVDYKRVQRHDSRPFRADVRLKENGTIATAIKHKTATLVSIKRTAKGMKHVFVTESGDSIVKYHYKIIKVNKCPVKVNECYGVQDI